MAELTAAAGLAHKRFVSTFTIILAGLYILGLAVFVLAPINALNWASLPFPGFVVEQTGVITGYSGVSWQGSRLGLNYPQKVTWVGSFEVVNGDDFLSAMSRFSVGQDVSIQTVLPDGSVRTYPAVTLHSFPSVDLLKLFWLPYVIGLVYLVLGIWVLIKRWYTRPGRMFAYFSLWAALGNGLLFELATSHVFAGLWSVAICQLGAILFYMAVWFPEELPIIRQYPRLVFVPGVIGLLLTIWGLLALNYQENPWQYINAWRYSYNFAALGIAVFIGTMIWRVRTSTNPIFRQQVRITLWGSVFSFLPVGLYFGSSLVGADILWNPILFLPLLLIFPVSIGLAVMRYQLWDIDNLINRTLVYGVVTALLVGLFAGTVTLLQGMFANVSGFRSTLAAAVATLMIVALFEPLRSRVQTFVDRRFYRTKYDIARTLTEFSAVVRDEVSLDRLKANLFSVIKNTMDPDYLNLCNCLDPTGGLDPIGEDDPLRAYLIEHQDVIEIERVYVKSAALESFRQAGARLIVPLVSQGQLVGILNLGLRRGERPYSHEDRRLLGLLASQVAPALRVSQMIQQQQIEALEWARIHQEMKVASLIQHSLLPHELPQLAGWQISVHYQPARAVGGDFYDFLMLEDGRLMLAVGDVTDKGVPAALIMATTRSVLRGAARRLLPPGIALQRSNNLLCPEMLPNMFVTCFYAILNPLTGQIAYANAGQCLPCVHQPGEEVNELYATGMPLGLLPDMNYEENSAILQPGDSLLLYSDGLIEAHSPQRELFGVPRLKARVAALSQREDFLPAMLGELKEFCGPDADQEDDVTLVLIKRL